MKLATRKTTIGVLIAAGSLLIIAAAVSWLNDEWRRKAKNQTVIRPILKQFGDLRSKDFAEHPVWVSVHLCDYGEPWYGDANEETFRPWANGFPVSPADGMFLVLAKFTLVDGREFDGFVTPQADSEAVNLGAIQPQMFLPSGRRNSFWDGMFKRSAEDRKIFYDELGKDPKGIFPIRFAANKDLAKGRISGMIEGFYLWSPKGKVEVYH